MLCEEVLSQNRLPPYSCPVGSEVIIPNNVKIFTEPMSGFSIDGSWKELFDRQTCGTGSPQCFGCSSGIPMNCAGVSFEYVYCFFSSLVSFFINRTFIG